MSKKNTTPAIVQGKKVNAAKLARTLENKRRRAEKHASKHPNDKGIVKDKSSNTEVCSICGRTEHVTHIEYSLLPAEKKRDIPEEIIRRCRMCRNHKIASNVPSVFPEGYKETRREYVEEV